MHNIQLFFYYMQLFKFFQFFMHNSPLHLLLECCILFAVQKTKISWRHYIMKEKVVLAYSGGLDTTAIIPWLKENFDYEVICVCVDCGQGEELDGLEERAKSCGAAKLYIEDVTDEFCDEYIMPCVQAHAVYENKYLLGTSMARPVIAKKLVEIARKEGASAI